jgi:spermidine synthase
LLTIALAALLAVPPGAIKAARGVLYEAESQYQYIDVRERDDGSRVLELNEGVVVNSVWYPNSVLTGGEWDMFLVVPPLVPHPVRRALVLGNAGGSTARGLAALYPGVEIDGVELDPKVTDAARRFLGLDAIPRLHVITADARAYLRSTSKRYDVIAIDTYRQPYIPFQVTTREFFQLVRSHLTPGGAVALNVARFPGDRGLLSAIAATVRTELGQAWTWDALRFNTLLFAFESPVTREELVRRVGAAPASLAVARAAVSPTGRPCGIPRQGPYRRPRSRGVARRPRDRLLHCRRRPRARRTTCRPSLSSWYKAAMPIEPIDLLHLGNERVIGVYVVDTPEGTGALRLRAGDMLRAARGSRRPDRDQAPAALAHPSRPRRRSRARRASTPAGSSPRSRDRRASRDRPDTADRLCAPTLRRRARQGSTASRFPCPRRTSR